MSDSPQDFDLKFLPDWLKETPSPNRYAQYEGEGDRPTREHGERRGPPRGDRLPERRGPRDRRGPRPPGGDRPRGPRGDQPPGGRRRDDRRGGPRPPERGRRDEDRPPREAPKPAPAELRIEFLPEPNAGAGIARQIKSSGRAYAVFPTAKLFLERPERHRVRLTSAKADVPLFQIGDGPVAFDRAAIERSAFLQAKDEFYTEETVQGEPIKGNFTNVARVRTTGALLGPTNYHAYQPALRKLYEERFSRRMSFPEFQQHEIEVVSDEQTVAAWKEQARNSTTYTTKKEAEPVTFKTLFDVEQHFRKSYLPQLVSSGPMLECSGPASRVAVDRHVASAVRNAWERERAFPQGMVNALRPFFAEAGLHFFKHRKRVLHVGAIKPVRHPEGHPFSDGITSILKTVQTQPRIKRPQLAAAILGEGHESPEAAPRKAQLAADLHYLIHAGHVIEFADGSLDLPLSPKDEVPQERPARPAAMAGKKTPLPAVPAADAVTDESLVPPSAPGGGRPDEGGLVAEEPPPAEEEPVPGEEEGEADPIEAAEYAPILSEQSESAALEGETPSGDPITPETMEAVESAPFENPAGKSSQPPPA